MTEDPLTILLMTAAGVWIFRTWYLDTRAATTPGATAQPGSLPGTTWASPPILIFAAAGSLLIVALETAGELALGISAEQTDITALFLLAMISAGVIEEVIFRGYLIRLGHGHLQLWLSIVGFSLIFTLLHPFLWTYETPEGVPGWQFWQASWGFDFSTKAWFTSAFLFLNSIWFYLVRIHTWNPEKSLLPCFVAHIASNIGVFSVKLFQGHVVGFW